MSRMLILSPPSGNMDLLKLVLISIIEALVAIVIVINLRPHYHKVHFTRLVLIVLPIN